MKKTLLLLLSVFAAITAFSQDFIYENIGYKVLDEEARTCELSYCSWGISEEVTIPEYAVYNEKQYAVISIREGAFSNQSKLTAINVLPENPNFSAKDGVLFNKDFTTIISYPRGKSGKYNDMPTTVTSIRNYAFMWCYGLTEVTIPNSVIEIGNHAFDSCSGLTEITIPNSVIVIQHNAFDNCSGLTEITIPEGVIHIGEAAFDQCSSMTNIIVEPGNSNYSAKDGILFDKDFTTLILYPGGRSGKYNNMPTTVKCIASYAFSGCSGLTEVTIPNSVTEIRLATFQCCSGLISITIPNSVTEIGAYAFSACSALTEITIPNSVTEIGASAFSNCKGLTEITIPNSVTEIGEYAFQSCPALAKVYYAAENPISAYKNIFDDETYANATLYLPEVAVIKAASIEPWCNFGHVEAYEFNGIEEISADIDMEAPVEVYSLMGVKVATSVDALPAGIYVVRSGDKSRKIAVK